MRTAVYSIIILGLLSCSTEPQPIVYGEDACHSCKMTIVDKKFGAEVVSKKGKLYKFDDVNCMLNFLNSGNIEEHEITHRLVIDFATPEKLFPVEHAFFLKSDNIRSPMGSQVAAFERKEELEVLKKEVNGIYLAWGELVSQVK